MEEEYLEFRLGRIGRCIPLIVAGGFLFYAGSHESNVNGYFVAFLMAIIVGAMFCKVPGKYGEACIYGLSKPYFPLIAMSIMLASICGKMISNSGMMQVIVYYIFKMELSNNLFLAASFLLCCILSFATGTSVGTYMISFPIFFPIAMYLGIKPSFIAGALVSGAIFGDNLAPISDTTIASAGTQNAEMGNVVKTRSIYSLTVACGVLIFLLLAHCSAEQSLENIQMEALSIQYSNKSLFMMIVPIVIIILCLKHVHLIVALSAGVCVSVITGILSGIYTVSDICSFPGNFKVEGIFVDAVLGTSSTIFMLVSLFSLMGVLEKSGIISDIGNYLMKLVRGKLSAEIVIVLSVAILSWITGVVTVAIISMGTIVYQLGEEYGINKYRRANLMDCGGLAMSSLVPWSVHAIIPVQLAMSNFENLKMTPIDIISHNFYSIGMCLMLLLMIFCGFGRNRNPG